MRKRYDPVGRCIYCGETSSVLTLEHIIPYGLSGELELPGASCEECARITSRFEGYCLRTMLVQPRQILGLKTRRPKKRPATLTAGAFDESGVYTSSQVPTEEYPISIQLPEFNPPRALFSGLDQDGLEIAGVGLWFNEKWETNQHLLGPKTAFHTALEVSSFSKLLCKIAFGFAVGELGRSRAGNLLPDAILGKSGYECSLVGNFPVAKPAGTAALHTLSLARWGRWTICNVGLFSRYGAPSYVVVVALT